MKSLANEFFKTMEDGARQHQAAHHGAYELVATGIKDEQDVARQIALVEQMMARRVQAIVLAPADSKALVGVTRRAVDAGIVVVNIDNRLDRDAMAERRLTRAVCRARQPRRRAGRRPRRRRAAGGGRPHRHPRRRAQRVQRHRAHARVSRTPRARRACGSSGRRPRNWETARANQVVSALVTEQPGVKAILCANDSMALGAVAALKAAGRQGGVLVAGFDNISAVQALVAIGRRRRHRRPARRPAGGVRHRVRAAAARRRRRAPADRQTPVDLITADRLPMTTRREWLGPGGERWLLLVIGFSLATDHFFSWTTMVALANQAPEALLLATGMTLVVLTGGIDLSVGSVLALSAATFGTAGRVGLDEPGSRRRRRRAWWAQRAGSSTDGCRRDGGSRRSSSRWRCSRSRAARRIW